MDIDTFLSLLSFAHRSLWRQGEPVWMPLHYIKDYLKEQSFRIEVDVPKNVHLVNSELISIGEGTILEPGVMIIGPCIIGKNCVLRHGAYLREEVILGDGCHIGHSAELKHSILLDHVAATHFVYVGDSILGSYVNLGAGVKCANVRLDRKEVSVWMDGKKYNTGLKKFGAVVGDRVQIGCNSVLNPGTLVGKGSFAYPLTHLQGFIPVHSQIDAKGTRSKLLEKATKP